MAKELKDIPINSKDDVDVQDQSDQPLPPDHNKPEKKKHPDFYG